MAEIDDLDNWIQQNHATKQGTPEFVQNANRYRELRSQEEKAARLPDAEAELRANRAANPGGFDATMNRVFSGAATGIPDLAIAGYNAAARGVGYPGAQADYLGPKMIEAGGGGQLPADASALRKLLEAGGSALLGGGAGAAGAAAAGPMAASAPLALRTAAIQGTAAAPTLAGAAGRGASSLAATTLAPTITSHYGGDVGGYAADKLGLDKETGSLLGSLVGGVVPGAARSGYARYSHNYYADKAAPDAARIAAAAREERITPTAGMLGNDIIKSQEKNFVGEHGASNYTSNLRRGVREDIGDVIDRAAVARGSTNPAPTPGDIGYDTAQIARVGAENYRTDASRRQQDLMDQIGPRTGTDIQSVIDAMNRVGQSTDRLTRGPIQARVDALRADLPRDQQGNIISTELPYEVVKDARSGLRSAGEGYSAVSGRHAGDIEGALTGAMRDTAVSRGVSPDAFDRTQQHYAATMGEGGPHETLSGISDITDPMRAYSYLRAGEQAPGNLRTLQATGLPELDRVLGDYIRSIAGSTINTANSRGPVNFANKWQGMTQGARDAIGGTQMESLDRAAVLSRAYDYPPNQMGTTRMAGGTSNSAVNSILGPAALGWAAEHIQPGAAAPVAAAAKFGLMPIINNLRARNLQSPETLNALSGGPAPQVMSINDLVAALNATSASQQQQRGPQRGVPR